MFSVGYMTPDGSIVVMMLACVASICLSVAIESNRPSSARAHLWVAIGDCARREVFAW